MKIGCTTNAYVTKFGHEKGLGYISQGGIDALDYGLFGQAQEDALMLDDEEFAKHFAEVKEICVKLGLEVGQLHSPMPSYVGEEKEDARLFELQRRAIIAASMLGSKYIIIHPAIPRIYRYTAYREETKKINMDFYSRLAPTAEKYGVKICLENMFNGDPKHPAGYCICPTVMT
nr:TIM barrel protein [Clostridia bacterium]